MGDSIAWIARLGDSDRELIAASRRAPTGERVRRPSDGFYLMELASETPRWLLVAAGYEAAEDLDDAMARSLSADGQETLRFACVESVMATQLACFRDGNTVWSIVYEGDSEDARPLLTGEVPSVAQEILSDLEVQQAADPEVDFLYELTAKLGQHLTGFHHDAPPSQGSQEPFQVLDFESESAPMSNPEPMHLGDPMGQLLRSLVQSGTIHGRPLEKTDDQLTIGVEGAQVVVSHYKQEKLQVVFFEGQKTSRCRGDVEVCAKRIRAFYDPRRDTRSYWKKASKAVRDWFVGKG